MMFVKWNEMKKILWEIKVTVLADMILVHFIPHKMYNLMQWWWFARNEMERKILIVPSEKSRLAYWTWVDLISTHTNKRSTRMHNSVCHNLGLIYPLHYMQWGWIAGSWHGERNPNSSLWRKKVSIPAYVTWIDLHPHKVLKKVYWCSNI